MNAGIEAGTRRRYHRIDGWRGYHIPPRAIVGASDTGTWDDSPAPSDKVAAELRRFQREALRPAGIRSRQIRSQSSNVFMVKRWLTVAREDFERAAKLAAKWLEDHNRETRYIHGADLEDLGIAGTN